MPSADGPGRSSRPTHADRARDEQRASAESATRPIHATRSEPSDERYEPSRTRRGDHSNRHTRARASRPARAKRAGRTRKKGSFWRELPMLIVVAVVLTFAIQTFIARIYVIPSGSMETTLHGCTGCSNDRVVADKLTYRFTDPAPGDVIIFRGPPAWQAADTDSLAGERSANPLVRGLQDGLSLLGLAAPDETDFIKRVIAVGGQTVACCDDRNRVLVDGQPITEPYLYFQPGTPGHQTPFDPIRVPDGQLWVMGDNRNNSEDARYNGPVPVDDVIGRARAVVLPITRWRTVPTINPQSPPPPPTSH